MARGAASLATALIVIGTLASAARAEPFLTRNQNPLLALYGLPAPLPSRVPAAGGGRFAAAMNWSNAAATESSDDNAYTVDGEVTELRLHLDHATSDRFALHAELPWRHLSAGSLDGVIDEWHELLGLPDGSRNRLPEKELLIEYRAGTATLLYVDMWITARRAWGTYRSRVATSCLRTSGARSPRGSP